ncbi:MFS general substrate transporter [Thozetella sp. PMI_491]|nr:MFS general substrate transporter [Thozetella sp. PMI_491]
MAEPLKTDIERAASFSSSILGPEDKKRRKHTSADISGSVFLIAGDGRVLKLPIPSDSPRDPLSWSTRKRVGIFVAMIFFEMIVLFSLETPGLMYRGLTREFGRENIAPFDIGSAASVPTLFLGIGAVFWIPVSIAIGRRPVAVLCSILYTLSIVWAALSGSFRSYIWAISLEGFAGGCALGTMLLVIIDITFIDERPQAIAIWISCVGATSLAFMSLLPLMVDLNSHWRPFYYIWIAPAIASVVIIFFFVPETYFLRPPVAFNGQILMQSGAERIRIYEDWNCLPYMKQPTQAPQLSGFKKWLRSLKLFGVAGGDWRSALACYPQMIKCIANPLIFYVALMNAVNFGGMMSIGITFPRLLSSPAYALPAPAITLVNLAASAGALLAWPASGIMIDRITKRLATLNGGVRHAEYLLPGYVLPVLAGAASVFIYGVVADRHYHFLWVYLAYGLNAFSYASMSVANTLWVTEAFPYWAAAALAVVGGVSYIVSFAISSFIEEWVGAQGYLWVNVAIGIALMLLGFVGVPVAFWGKSIRQYIHGRWGVYEAGALRPQ